MQNFSLSENFDGLPENLFLVCIFLEVNGDGFGSPDFTPCDRPLRSQDWNISGDPQVNSQDLPDLLLNHIMAALFLLLFCNINTIEHKVVLPRLVQLPKLILCPIIY